MEKIVEYSVDEKVSYTWTLTTLENGKSPVKFKDIEKLKYDCVIGIIFWRSERIFDLDGRMCDGQDEIERKYYFGKEYNYNDLPENARLENINSLLVKEQVEAQNPKCVVTRENEVYLLEDCGYYITDDCEKVVIDPDDLDKIKEITKDGIVYVSQNENNGAENQENGEGIEQ